MALLECNLQKMGFYPTVMDLIMRCVTSVSYSFGVKGMVVGRVKSGCGIRLGDPLSPYLFVLVSQGLSALLSDAVSNRCIKGLKVASTSLIVSHLFFADDSLLFFRTTIRDTLQIIQCLQLYERASGCVINYEKTAITFIPAMPEDMQEHIKSCFQISVV